MSAHLVDGVTVVLVAATTLGVGSFGMRRAKTTGDFYVASRSVSPRWNAAAISGEYLSAASFLGIAGLVLAYGFDALWYPVCYTAGYLVLLALIAAPLRRSGAYTLPDFAQLRLGSQSVQVLSRVLIVVIGFLYLIPQLQGASLTLRTQTGAPTWLGGLVVGAVVLVVVAVGGMRSITFAQALQFWLKLTAVLVPALVLSGVWLHRHDQLSDGYPRVPQRTVVQVAAGTNVRVVLPQRVVIDGTVDHERLHGPLTLTAGAHYIAAGTTVTLPKDAVVPVDDHLPSRQNSSWLAPLGIGDHPLYASWSLIIAICLGTMGLPHVLVRFYTNSNGRDARRTSLGVLVLLSCFYLGPTVLAALGRRYVPDLLLTGNIDATVLQLPERMLPGLPGVWLGSLVTAGAFAAFMSTASGLTASVAGVVSQYWRRAPVSTPIVARRRRIARFRAGVAVSVVVPYLLSLTTDRLGLAAVVGLAFAVAAATFCPLLVLGVWWPRLTDRGAMTGLIIGGVLASAAALSTMIAAPRPGWVGSLLAEPAAWAVPITFAVMVGVSLATPGRVPTDVMRVMARLHTPEQLSSPPHLVPDRSPHRAPRSSHRDGRTTTKAAVSTTGHEPSLGTQPNR